MKTFISWSGDKSKKVAALLQSWIPEVLQAVEPWYSPEDIKSGEQWLAVISSSLEESKFGIVCLTQDNQHSPWIMYEAGALAKGTKVCPFLIDVKRSDITGPLAGTNNIEATKGGLLKLISDMNEMLDKTIDAERLKNIFERAWPDFEKEFQEIITSSPAPKAPPRSDREILEEILDYTRSARIRNSRAFKNRIYTVKTDLLDENVNEKRMLKRDYTRKLIKDYLSPKFKVGDYMLARETISGSNLQNIFEILDALDMNVSINELEEIYRDVVTNHFNVDF